MATKDIRTAHVQVMCDVCGRTLLRGERAETYLAGGSRRQVCELCTARAVHEGWVREGAALERGTRSFGGERRRSLLGRLRRAGAVGREDREEREPLPPGYERAADRGNGRHHPSEDHVAFALTAAEPRQVHAVPTSLEQRTVSAVERFNRSEHPRTVAGVARSLGAPVVVVRPAEDGPLMTVVVSWELCWYRYEVDLSDDMAAVRCVGQGYELSEIPGEDRAEPNAAADEYGTLSPV
jgi:hypothetical protein